MLSIRPEIAFVNNFQEKKYRAIIPEQPETLDRSSIDLMKFNNQEKEKENEVVIDTEGQEDNKNEKNNQAKMMLAENC